MSHVTPAPSRNVLYYGREEPVPEQVELRAGALSMIYEEGGLRFISLGDREVLRGLYVAVRDRFWRTVPPVLGHVDMRIGADAFSIAYDAAHRSDEVDFAWKGEIMGDPDGTITFRMEGAARRRFLRNRIGLCVLHGARECAGARCEVEHIDGIVERAVFPGLISPHQPFLDIRTISHEVAPGVWAEVAFAGDVFEMEDQRNWTDASFKTYSPPLRLPFPIEVPQGAIIAQSVTLRLRGTARPGARASSGCVALDIGPPSMPVPGIGLGVARHGQPLTEREVERLKALNLIHLRVDLHLAQAGWIGALERVTREARALGTAVEAALFLSERARDELQDLRHVLATVKPPVSTWLVFHAREASTTRPLCVLAREMLKPYDLASRIGGGTDRDFAQLNRGLPPTDALDLVCYSVNPQVHAFDNTSLIESFEGCRWTVSSAREFAAGLPLAVTPVTLRPRLRPPATGPEPEPAAGVLPPHVDVRQMSLLGAGWTVGVVKAFAESGVQSLTLYETAGWNGVTETDAGSPLPELFKSIPGAVYPLYHVLADVGEFRGGRVLPVTSSAPMAVDGLAVELNDRRRILVTNFRDRPARAVIEGCPTEARVRLLDEHAVLYAMQAPEAYRREAGTVHRCPGGRLELALLPFAVACIDDARPPEETA